MSSTSWAETAPAEGPEPVPSEARSGPWGDKATDVTRLFHSATLSLGSMSGVAVQRASSCASPGWEAHHMY
jgi:hypothetical protein